MPNVYRKYDSKSGVWADFGDLNARKDIGIVEDTDIAEHSIDSGQYVIWKGKLYTANSAITPDTTLSTSNLTEVTIGGLNKLNESLSVLNNLISSQVLIGGQTFRFTFPSGQYAYFIMLSGINPTLRNYMAFVGVLEQRLESGRIAEIYKGSAVTVNVDSNMFTLDINVGAIIDAGICIFTLCGPPTVSVTVLN